MKEYSILLVDDEEIILKSLGLSLRDEGYNVTLAKNGEEAIKLLSERSNESAFDMVITDLMMEGMDGIEVLKEAKRISPIIKVIILTGYGSLDSAIDAIEFDVDDYLLKPPKLKDLRFKIDRCLERLEFQKKIKLYEDLLPVCCVCKKVRDDTGKEHGTGEWLDWQVYLKNRAKIDITHGYCPGCSKKTLEDAGVFQGVKK